MTKGRSIKWAYITISDHDFTEVERFQRAGYESLKKQLHPATYKYLYDEMTHVATTSLSNEIITIVQIVWKLPVECYLKEVH